MIVGLRRHKGPQGGDLTPIGKTGLMAERLETDGEPRLSVWRPKDRNDPATWERVDADQILWDAPPPKGEEGERRVQVVIKGQSQELVLQPPMANSIFKLPPASPIPLELTASPLVLST